MSLPPGFLEELRSRVSLAQVAGRKVSWDARKSNQGKGDMWAPCPFHQEKTASFHVDDRKGFYYCFGCHEKGDAIGFVMASENVDFIEAVKILASEAGLSMPERDPQAQEQADRRTLLVEVMEDALRFYRTQLGGHAGRAARDYLAGRGLGPDAVDSWQLGFAPDGWQSLWEHLRAKGIAEKAILEAGLAKPSDRGRAPYDSFRNRIIFPIRDTRGRTIAFGGRAMASGESAKYLNSPETPLFDKGRTLYNHGPAREAAGKDARLIVTEGYMDVIALSEAGFAATVAPLGTAITEGQLKLLWRIHPEPVVALDGDTAGRRAALKLMDMALPMLEAGKSLRFCLMPQGLDPDDFIRARGAAAMQDLIDRAEPMVDLLWRREIEGKTFDSPERRAALDKSLRETIERIRDPSIRRHYGGAVKERSWELFRSRRPGRAPSKGRWAPPASASPETRASALASGETEAELERRREAVVLAVLVKHAALVRRFEDAIERTSFRGPDHARIVAVLLRRSAGADGDMTGALIEEGEGQALERLTSQRHLTVVPALRTDDAEMAALCVAEELGKLAAQRGAAQEIDEALQDFSGVSDEAITWRLSQAAEARNRAVRSDTDDRAEYELAPNGVRLNRSERSALDKLLDRIGQGRGRGK